MTERRVRVGLVGAGWWGAQVHLPAVTAHPRAELTALSDPDVEQLEAVGDRFGIGHRFLDSTELLESALVDAVIIATPHAFHHPIAKRALDLGLHVLVEKPMTISALDAADLAAAARAAGRHLLVGFTHNYTSAASWCREAVDDGKIGDLVSVSCLYSSAVEQFYRGTPHNYPDPFHSGGPRPETYSDVTLSGGGQGQTQAPHAVGMALYVSGGEPIEVTAYLANLDLSVDIADAAAFRLRGGAIGTLHCVGNLTRSQPHQPELRFYGTDGLLIQDLYGGRVTVVTKDGRIENAPPVDDPYPMAAPARALIDAVLGVDPPTGASADVGVRTVELIEAMYRSASLGRSVAVEELYIEEAPKHEA